MSHSIEYYTCLCTYSIVYTVPWIRIHSRARSRSIRLWGVRIRSRTRNNPYVSGPGPTSSLSGNKSHTPYTRTEQGQNIHFVYVCTYTTQIDTCTYYSCVHRIQHAHVHTHTIADTCTQHARVNSMQHAHVHPYIIAHTDANTYTHTHVYQHLHVHPSIHTKTPSHPFSHTYRNVCDTNIMLFDI